MALVLQPRHVLTLLKRRKDDRRENIAYKLIWFRSSVFVDNVHPFMGGVFRLKGRQRRSPRFPVETVPLYYWRRTKDVTRWAVRTPGMLIEMRRLYVSAKRDPGYTDVAIAPEPLPPRRRSESPPAPAGPRTAAPDLEYEVPSANRSASLERGNEGS